jgi:hypothetical protein
MVKASELIKIKNDRNKLKNKIFDKIYERIEIKITKANQSNLSKCWYELPEFIFNLPLYNMESCKLYIIKKLKINEFKSHVINNIIYISWDSN